jgi:hypothetical protein
LCSTPWHNPCAKRDFEPQTYSAADFIKCRNPQMQLKDDDVSYGQYMQQQYSSTSVELLVQHEVQGQQQAFLFNYS